jgi:UDP-N-acetyl-D-mannosaminuronic acid dehydrogenase
MIGFDITIIGAGRVGLPFALVLEKSGFKIAVKEVDKRTINFINKKKTPFKENGIEKLIKKTKIKTFLNKMPDSKTYIITVGTPLMQNIETDFKYIIKVIDQLINSKKIKNKNIILRSTIAPNSTNFISKYIKNKTGYSSGKEYFLSYCPERIVEGNAIKELYKLPQIVGVSDNQSWLKAKSIFLKLIKKNKILKSTYVEAELAKLFSNVYRYINFSIPNYFLILANQFKVEPFSLFDLMNKEYPRNKGLKMPGLTAGTCLRKDYGMINENLPYTDLVLQAHKINEFLPLFITNLLDSNQINNRTIGILGYSFKKDTDDERDSLTPKIYRYLSRLAPKKILISDYNLPNGLFKDKYNSLNFKNFTESEILKKSDVVIIAMNHSKYIKLRSKIKSSKKIIIDPWRVLSDNLVNYYGN